MPLAFTTGTSSHPKNTLRKRKLEIKVLLLLHVLIPGVMLSSSLETINPWLSACDLKQQGPSDLKGSCSAPTQFPARTARLPDVELLCPKECHLNESKTNASCLAYLDETRRNAICNFNLGNGIEWLKSFLGTIRLRHCCEYKIIESLSSSLLDRVLRGKDECFSVIDSLVEVDNLAARATCEFSEVLSRYDCGQPYSVKFSCNDCLEAYRRWVCSTLVPYFNESMRIRPCRSVCQAVEQKCPYFLPENKAPTLPTQYAGEPTFLCIDPYISETGEQQKKSLYPDENTCCVKICGSLKDGLCVEKDSKCKSEKLASYEEALDQTVECPASETFGSRVPSMECTASEPYSSPHKLGSGGARSLPGAPLVLMSAYLGQPLSCGVRHLLVLLLLFLYYCFPASLVQTLACLSLVSAADISRDSLPQSRFNMETKFFFHLVKRHSLIFNYFKFNSNKWQYYFILISVNLLLFNSLTKNPEPLATPSCLINGFEIGEKTRRARRYYYFYYNHNYYYYYYKHYYYYTILSRIAQNSNDYYVLNSRKSRDLTQKPFKLVCIQSRNENGFISIKNDYSLTINSIKTHSDIIIIILVRNLGGEVDARIRCRFGRRRTSTERPEAGDAAAMLAEGPSRPGPGPGPGLRIRRPKPASERLQFMLVMMCRLTRLQFSDPQCEFQTFLKKS